MEEADRLTMLICRLLCRRTPSEIGNENSWKQSQGTDEVQKKSCRFQEMGAACLTKLKTGAE